MGGFYSISKNEYQNVYKYHIFHPAKVSFFLSFCNEQERKLDAHFLDKTGVVYQLYGKMELKPTKSSLSQKNESLARRNIPAIWYMIVNSISFFTITQSV